MKKQFLTLALLATVAVGGAFAGNSTLGERQGAPFNASAPCGVSLKTCCDCLNEPCTYEIEPGEFIQLFDNTSPAPGTCSILLYELPE